MKNHLTLLAAISLLTLAAPARADGIDCSKAQSPVEKLICANADIKTQDDTMAQLYKVAAVNMFGSGHSGEPAAQRSWRGERDKCAAEKPDKQAECVRASYTARNLELAYAALPAAPDLALKVLRDQKIKTAGAFEALTLFASEPDGTDWSNPRLQDKRQKVTALIKPYLPADPPDDNPDDPNSHFAVELFADSGIAEAADALKSDHGFANFLRAATYDSDAVLPCAFVVAHPGLREATNSYFGATPDNFIITTNCRTASPPLPKFAALLDEITKGWPQCDGTIRFAAYRSYDGTVDHAIAPAAAEIQNWKPTKRSPDANQPHRLIGVGKADVQAAEAELAAYYVQYLKAPADKAAAFAKLRLEDINADGQQCD